ncbi:hypothetical protein Pla108_22060 [Botrimarina colliarenosi]|uniref:Uncharacterized protein n=1 Tax=Botrimarina colliarenosi TaxID=2528001 RepID=A0A5C6AG65_9BACT|nr:hypothetical protein [Botrimarina colliarenosi]TWT98051.1 hypothetical protein Pla108_22060 [Botrimarina colliarenosi]
MIRRSVALLLAVVSGGAAAEADGWRDSLPADWAVAVEVRDLAALERNAERLLAPWGRHAPAVTKTLERLCPGVELAPRPWGAALVVDKRGVLSPVVYVPTEDYATLCDTLNADRADDLAVANVAGFDLALADRGDWVQISLLDAAPRVSDAPNADPPRSLEEDAAAITLVVSPLGLERIADTLTERRRGQLDAGRGLIGPWRWPAGFDGFVDRAAPYGPLAAELAAWGRPLTVRLDADGESLRLVAQIDEPLPSPEGEAAGYATSDNSVAHVAFSRPLPPKLIDLAIAWMQCRPDEIDAPEYPQPQWDDLAEAYRALLSGYRSGATVLTLPAAGEPVATNQAAAFAWDGDATQFGDAVRLVVTRWNQLIDAADARTPLRIAMAPLDGAEGWRLSTNLFEGFNLERSPEVATIFDQYYGGEELAIDLTRRGADGWLVSFGPPPADLLEPGPPRGEEGASNQSAPLITGELRLDRWFAWKRLVEDVDMAGVVGRRRRKPMAEAPAATLRVDAGDRLRIEATLPMAAYERATTHWRSDTKADSP